MKRFSFMADILSDEIEAQKRILNAETVVALLRQSIVFFGEFASGNKKNISISLNLVTSSRGFAKTEILHNASFSRFGRISSLFKF